MYEATKLTYDLGDIPEKDFERLKMTSRRGWYYHANLTFHLLVKNDVQFWVTFGQRELARVTIPYL